ncbi:17255_t:CDS:1, partial [Dentiscutata heterogama]
DNPSVNKSSTINVEDNQIVYIDSTIELDEARQLLEVMQVENQQKS